MSSPNQAFDANPEHPDPHGVSPLFRIPTELRDVYRSLTMSPTVQATDLNPEMPDPRGICHLFRIPTELRLQIIEPLLSLGNEYSTKRLYPQILATCRTIHNECQATLKENVLISIVKEHDDLLTGLGRPWKATKEFHKDATLHQDLAICSKIPTDCSGLVICVSMTTEDLSFYLGNSNAESFKYCITLFAVRIARFTSARKVNVWLRLRQTEVHDTPESILPATFSLQQIREGLAHVLQDLFLPLKTVRPALETTFSGLSQPILTALKEKWAMPSQIEGLALSRWLDLEGEADELIRLCKDAGLEKTGTQFLPRLLGAWLPSKRERRYETDLEFQVQNARKMMGSEKWTSLRKEAEDILQQRGSSDDSFDESISGGLQGSQH